MFLVSPESRSIQNALNDFGIKNWSSGRLASPPNPQASLPLDQFFTRNNAVRGTDTRRAIDAHSKERQAYNLPFFFASKGLLIMRLIVVRHADAVNRAPTDAARVLSEKGRADAVRMGAFIARTLAGDVTIASSPYVRSMETATIVRAAIGLAEPVRKDPALASGMTPEQGCGVIHQNGTLDGTLILIGHAPDLGMLTSYLLGSDASSIPMQKGAAVCLDVKRPGFASAELLWFIHPALV